MTLTDRNVLRRFTAKRVFLSRTRAVTIDHRLTRSVEIDMKLARLLRLLHSAFIVCTFLPVAASSREACSQQVAQSLRSKVESGLSLRVKIDGRPFEHWTIQDRMHVFTVCRVSR